MPFPSFLDDAVLVQGVQQEMEALKRETPALTRRPSRDLAPMRTFIDNDKVIWLTHFCLTRSLSKSCLLTPFKIDVALPKSHSPPSSPIG